MLIFYRICFKKPTALGKCWDKLKNKNRNTLIYLALRFFIVVPPDIIKEIITENIERLGGMIDYVVLEIQEFIINEIYKIEFLDINKKESSGKSYSNPQKLALLHELGFFELPIFKNINETKINEITGFLLNANPKEFVYKNRLNLKSKSPNYQTDKYTAYQYLEEMKKLIFDT